MARARIAAPAAEEVLASSLIEDATLYPRHHVDLVHVGNLARALEAGHELPALIADRASRRLVDGFHRRLAHLKVGGDDAMVQVIWQDFTSEAELFAEVVRLNTQHGQRLNRQDEIRVALMGERFGLTTARIAAVLHVKPERVEQLKVRVVVVNDVQQPAKLMASHAYGQELTAEQHRTMRSASGNNLMQSVRQMHRIIESGLFDAGNAELLDALHRLAGIITEKIPQGTAVAG